MYKFTRLAKFGLTLYMSAFITAIAMFANVADATTITTRTGKGAALTHAELETNFFIGTLAKTADYTLTEPDNRDTVEFNGSSLTATLPDAATIIAATDTGDYQVTLINLAATALTVARTGTDTINGGTSYSLGQYESATFKVNAAGTSWNVTAGKIYSAIDINGGAIDGTTIGNSAIDGTAIGGSTPAAGAFTTLSATGASTLAGGSSSGTWSNLGTVTTVDINGGTIDGAAIGGATPAAVTATTLDATGAFTSLGIDDNAASTAVTIDSGGQVGIGKAPTREFEVYGAGNVYMKIDAPTSQSGSVEFSVNNTVDYTIRDQTATSGGLNIAPGSATSATEGLKISSDGNYGFNVVPEAWASTLTAAQLGGNGAIWGDTTAGSGKAIMMTQNAYNDGANKYISTAEASIYQQYAGSHIFGIAASGTADTAISWTTTLVGNNDGSWDFGSGTVTIPTTDINGGAIDGTAIGGSTAAAGAFTTLSASGTISANGGQIAFPATQNASANANTFDDYEEGTTAVTLSANSGTITIDTSYDTLSHTKIGNRVFVEGELRVSSVSSPTGVLFVNGLPYTAASTSEGANLAGFSVEYYGINAATLGLYGLVGNGGTTISVYERDTTGTGVAAADNIIAGSRLYFNFHYRAAN